MIDKLSGPITLGRRLLGTISIIAFVLLGEGCVKLALRLSPSIFDDFSDTFFQECDPQLAKDALPAQLKLGEALLREDPGNKKILTSLCVGYSGYVFLFLERSNPQRASVLYHRALRYGLKVLGTTQDCGHPTTPNRVAEKVKKSNLPAAFWTSVSWLRWIGLNMDKPAALAQTPTAVALLKKVVQMNPSYFYGAPCAIMASVLASRPPALGGNLSSARELFERAFRINKGRLYLIPFLYARYYAVAEQDKGLFRSLLEQIINGPSSVEPKACLINQVVKQRAAKLMEKMDELFL